MRGRRLFPAAVLATLALLAVPGRASGMDVIAGFKLGAGYSGFTGGDFDEYLTTYAGKREFGLSTSAGLFMGLVFWDFLVVQPEVLFGMAGDTHTVGAAAYESGAPGTVERGLSLRSIEVPLLLKVKLGAVSLFAGPEVLFPLFRSSRQQASSSSVEDGLVLLGLDDTDPGRSAVRPFILGGTAGAGVDLAVGGAILTLEGRYTRTFQPFHEETIEERIIPAGYGFLLHDMRLMIGVGRRF